MKQQTIQIERDTLFIAHIGEEDAQYTYAVQKHAALTLVALIDAKKSITTNVELRLVGEFATATFMGIVRIDSDAHVCIHTLQHHEAKNTTSNLLVKSVLTDGAKLSYTGSILVDVGAQKTDAYQRNENLLLSSDAQVVSEPALEIKANDVRCTHGATISAVGTEELWYLMSRGVSEDNARALIADGFLKSTLRLIPDIKRRATIENDILPFFSSSSPKRRD